jgi:branched-chain amino acid transport system ATP-binding protein
VAEREVLLELRGVCSGYGDLIAVRSASLVLREATTTVLTGQNGAGKTSLSMAIAGLLPTYAGQVLWCGEDLHSVPAHKRTAKGLALVQEGKQIFRERTVHENLVIGATVRRYSGADLRGALAGCYEQFPVLKRFQSKKAGLLSGGQQQMLAIAQAVMGRPRLLIVDEPSAGLAPEMVGEVKEVLRDLVKEGMCLLIIEQDPLIFRDLCTETIVMSQGTC